MLVVLLHFIESLMNQARQNIIFAMESMGCASTGRLNYFLSPLFQFRC